MKPGARDTETENLLRNQISELREQIKQLKQRLVLSQQQVQAAQQMKKTSPIYEGVTSRIDTVQFAKNFLLFFNIFQGQPKRMPSPLLHNLRVIGPRDSFR
jgi:cell division septum initiation protein DivIVA